MCTGSTLILLAVRSGNPICLLSAPFVVFGTRRIVLAIALRFYRRRLQAQLLDAIRRLEALTRGSAAILTAFREVGQAAPRPLREEWQWVDDHLNQAYMDTEGDRPYMRHSDHAYAMRALARQTPLELHARVLNQLAAIYEQGQESNAPERLHQLLEVLREQDRLRRDLDTQLNHVRGEACVITGALALIVIWLLYSQAERVYTAFFVSPLGAIAALWFLFWFAAPLIVAFVLVKPPELPL
jgi:hypothetical protein